MPAHFSTGSVSMINYFCLNFRSPDHAITCGFPIPPYLCLLPSSVKRLLASPVPAKLCQTPHNVLPRTRFSTFESQCNWLVINRIQVGHCSAFSPERRGKGELRCGGNLRLPER